MPSFYHVGSMATENPIKNIAQFNQRFDIDKRMRMQGHRRTQDTIKHPCWNLEAAARYVSRILTASNDTTSHALRNAESEGLPKEGVPWIADFTNLGFMCFVLQGCTTRAASIKG